MIEFENTIIAVTARMACKSLPGRPMADIHGQPMVAHAAKAAASANIGHVMVVTADNHVAEAVRSGGGDALVSPMAALAEFEQIAAVLALRDPQRKFQYVMNLPCYFPNIDALSLRRCLAGLTNADVDVATLGTKLGEDGENIVKVVAALEGEREVAYAHDFTCASQPSPAWRHIGVYAYRRASLEKLATAKSDVLEPLRILQAGLRMAVVKVDTLPLTVDTPQKLEAARRLMKA
jgi:3-deoxy-manno-octulosonate cytidylyltransferase (CMP-KDO synthetase)